MASQVYVSITKKTQPVLFVYLCVYIYTERYYGKRVNAFARD